jgi:excisionase family DNA binding protein
MASDIEWLSTAEAAKRLGITPRTLYRFIDQGDVPAYRFGRVIPLTTDEVDEFIESCKIEPGRSTTSIPSNPGRLLVGAFRQFEDLATDEIEARLKLARHHLSGTDVVR